MIDSLKSYLVGGAVRDKLLGISAKDLDYVVVGATSEEMLKLGFMTVGKDFPVFLHPQTKHEYALARTERKVSGGYTGFSVDASQDVTLEEDLARRDLTINAMAMDNDGRLIDPFNGAQDIEHKVLRHVTEAFREDPLRVLRLARFRARLGGDWQIHSRTKELVSEIISVGELDHLVAERIFVETQKALGEPHPQLFFETLDELGALAIIFPELHQMHGIPQPPAHHPEGDVFVHTMLTLARAAELNFDVETRFACLCHDFGKPLSYAERGNLHDHEEKGVEPVETFCARLKVPNKIKQLAVLTTRYHLHTHKMFELKATTIYRVLFDGFNALSKPLQFQQFLQACTCDAQGRGPSKKDKPYPQADFALHILHSLQQEDAKAVTAQAIARGKQGKAIGEELRQHYIACIKNIKANYKIIN